MNIEHSSVFRPEITVKALLRNDVVIYDGVDYDSIPN